MKKIRLSALALCVIMMCAGPMVAQGQNRRNSSSEAAQKKESVQKSEPQRSQTVRPQSKQQSRPQAKPQTSQTYRPQAKPQPKPKYHQQAKPQPRPQQHYYSSRPSKPVVYSRPAPRYVPASNCYYGQHVHRLPHGAYRRVYNGVTYYYCNHVYYRPYSGGYVVCRPPVGATFSSSIIGSVISALIIRDAIESVASSNKKYYYDNGVYYTASNSANSKYTVVPAPAGSLVRELPDGYEEIEIEGVQLYKADGVLYKTTVYEGVPYFEVVATL